MAENELNLGEIQKLGGVLKHMAELINVMPEYAHLPEPSRQLIGLGFKACNEKLQSTSLNGKLTKEKLRILFSTAMEEATEKWLENNPIENNFIKGIEGFPEAALKQAQEEFPAYISDVIEPDLYKKIIAKAFDKIVASRKGPTIGHNQ